jgi:two-component system chemotaxis sensor kinase CheA
MTPLELLVATFVEEAAESLDELGRAFETLRDVPEAGLPQTLTDAMRVAHNLKGASLSVGLPKFADLCHRLEDELEAARNAAVRPSASDIDGWLTFTAALGDQARSSSLREAIAAGASPQFTGAAPPAASVDAPDVPAGPDGAAPDEVGRGGRAAGEPALPQEHAEPRRDGGDSSVRVDSRRLTDVMMSADEIRIAHGRGRVRLARVRQLLGELEQLASGTEDVPRRLSDLTSVWMAFLQDETREVHELGKLAAGLSHAVRRLTLLALTTQVAGWRGAVRDAAARLGKRVRLEVDVGLIELDKAVLDRLREPLGHLLRNAVDHGIEPEAERLAAGKPAAGRVLVRATAEGAFVNLQVIDDGRGLARDRIVDIAVSRGLVDEHARSSLSPEEIAALVFLPGFTTAGQVSRISGRGVGLHAVREAVDALGGSLVVRDGDGGSGCVFELSVPVTQISVSGLLVRAGHTIYAIPVHHIARAALATERDLEHSAGELVLQSPGSQPVPVRRLEAALDLPAPAISGRVAAVVLERGGTTAAFAVDEILGELEYVARPLPWNVAAITGLAGAVVLGDGALALAVDVPALLAPRSPRAAAGSVTSPQDPPGEAARERQRVLVVDDSLVTRTLARGTLAAAGFEVVLAVDGEDAWSKLRNERFDAVVTDIQMPRLDGFGLTERIRRDAGMRWLPVVLVTSLGDERHVKRGAEVGANAYVVKGQLEQRRLLDAVRKLVDRSVCPAC